MQNTLISLSQAVSLKEAGLVWRANLYDFFSIPDRGLDDRVFVIADVMATLDVFRGWPVVTFHGTAEWASDYVFSHEVVWIPTEGQLRQELGALLDKEAANGLTLRQLAAEYTCEIQLYGTSYTFSGATAAAAYADALLYLLRKQI